MSIQIKDQLAKMKDIIQIDTKSISSLIDRAIDLEKILNDENIKLEPKVKDELKDINNKLMKSIDVTIKRKNDLLDAYNKLVEILSE